MDKKTSPAKPSKVKILSDIILNPSVRLLPKSVNPDVPPPLAPLSSKSIIGSGVDSIQNVSDLTSDLANSNQPIEESLKRKPIDNVFCHEMAKKPKLKLKKGKGKVNSNEETVFNYMTGTYIKVARNEPVRNLNESHQDTVDIKDEITIHETVLENVEMTRIIEPEDINDESKLEPKLVNAIEQLTKLDDKKTTETIDLTEDDDNDNAESNISTQNNIFIQNVLALQNAIAWQTLVKPESDSKPPLQNLENNVVIANQSGHLNNLQNNVVFANQSGHLNNLQNNVVFANQSGHLSNLQNNVVIANQSGHLSNLQNNVVIANQSENLNNLQNNVVIANQSENLNNLQNNVVIANQSGHLSNLQNNVVIANQSGHLNNLQNNVVIANQSGHLNNIQNNVIVKNPHAILQNGVEIGSENPPNTVTSSALNQPMVLLVQNNSNFIGPQNPDFVKSPLLNNGQGNLFLIPNNLNIGPNLVLANQQSPAASKITNLVLQTNQSPVKKNTHILPKTSGLIQQTLRSSSPSGHGLSFNASKCVKTYKSPHSFKTPFSYLQNLKISSPNPASLSPHFACETCGYKSSTKRELILHIFDAHLKDDFELNLRCKVCNFETEFQGVMEKHDLGHGNGPQNQEKFDKVCLSHNVEIRIRPVQKVAETVVQKDASSPNKDEIDIIDLSDSDDGKPEESPKEIHTFRCFDCNFTTSTRQSLQNHTVRHVESKFKCSKHYSLKNACLECEYKSCLLDLKKDMLVCKKCNYRTCRKQCFNTHVKNQCREGARELFSSDSEPEDATSGLFKCFHCPHIAKSFKVLKYHAVRHFGAAFACDIHRPKNCSTCNKCIYEGILKSIALAVNECTVCGYKTLDKSKYARHIDKKVKCSRASKERSVGDRDDQTNKKLYGNHKNVMEKKASTQVSPEILSSDPVTKENFKCFHCACVPTSRRHLKSHAIIHYRQPFECSLHPRSTVNGCNQCLYKTILEDLRKAVLCCQDCGYKTVRRSDFDRHKRKKENCENHRKRQAAKPAERSATTENNGEIGGDRSNLALNYGIIPQEGPTLRPNVFVCAKCNFRAANKGALKLHQVAKCGNQFADPPQSTEQAITDPTLLNCFDCNEFCTEDRETLKEHAVMHYSKKFTCDKHAPSKSAPNCEKCIYRSIKNDVKNEVMKCKRCTFKTLDKHVFEHHQSSGNSCGGRKKKVGHEDDEDYIQNVFEHHQPSRKSCRVRKKPVGHEDHDNYSPNDDAGSGSNYSDEEISDSRKRQRSRREVGNMSSSSTAGKTQTRKNVTSIIAPKTSLSVFECFDCGLHCANQFDLETHITTHPDSTVNCNHHVFNQQCKKCVYQRAVGKTLRNEMSCKCGFTCNTVEAIREHAKSRAHCDEFKASNNVSSFKCYDCTKEFKSREKLWEHATRHQSDFKCADHEDGTEQSTCGQCLYALIQETINRHYFRCYDCNYRIFKCELDLKDHIETKHGKRFTCGLHPAASQDGCDRCRYAYIVVQASKKLLYFCAACRGSEYPFASWKNLRTHIFMKHSESSIKCMCHVDSKMFHECHMCLFDKILTSMRSQVFKCFECAANMLTKEQLVAHVRIVHRNSVFQCPEHGLGDIVENCDMCGYESIVVSMTSQYNPEVL